MKFSIRFLCIALVALSFTLIAATAARAQGFPHCNGTDITIKNGSHFPVTVCIKHIGCFDVPAGSSVTVPVTPGTEVPGLYGVANITYTWQANPTPPPALWIQSLAMLPTGNCFDVYYDEASCTIAVVQAPGPPCVHP